MAFIYNMETIIHFQTTMEYLKIVPNDLGKELIKISFR